MHLVRLIFAGAALSILLVGCSTGGASPTAPATAAPASVAPTEAPASVAPSEAPASVAPSTAAGATIVAGTPERVESANGMTVYYFTKDVKDSGTSACTGGCISTWPAVTVAAGGTPVAGAGLSGKVGTITRDDGSLQVTYNGLPLYFFKNDQAPGDANGVYENWTAVKP